MSNSKIEHFGNSCKFCSCLLNTANGPSVFCSCKYCIQFRSKASQERSTADIISYLAHQKTLLVNLILTILVWVAWYVYTHPDSLSILQQNWPITLTMTLGSFIAGATSEGGGAIAFPVFTKVLHIQPQDAKVFSLAIQSIGMTAATLTIIVMRVTVSWKFILWASLGGLFGVYIGSVMIAQLLSPELLKMLFTAMIVSFAIALLILRNVNFITCAFDLFFVRLLCCGNSYVASYAPVSTPRRQTKILRQMHKLFYSHSLTGEIGYITLVYPLYTGEKSY